MAATALSFFALICTSLVHAQIKYMECVETIFGDTSGDPVVLKEIDLPPPTRDWDIRIPQECPNGSVVGVFVEVCDFDGPPEPTVSILNTGELLVQRNADPLITSDSLQGKQVPLDQITPPPPDPYFKVTIPITNACPKPNGVYVYVCDPDGAAPTLSSDSPNIVYVTRNSQPAHPPLTRHRVSRRILPGVATHRQCRI